MIPTLTAVAHPWHCDVMGHMNTRHIAALIDDACFSLLDRLGCDVSGREARIGWADVRFELDLQREIPPGTVIQVASGIQTVGNSSFSHVHVVTSEHGAVQHARARVTTVRFDLSARKSVPLTDEFRGAARAITIETPSP